MSSSATEVTCKLGLNSGLVANNFYSIELLIKNKGYALQNNYYQVKFLPVITSITSTEGSLAGGAQLSVSGDGFVSSKTLVVLGSSSYQAKTNANITYTAINLETITNQAGTYELSVFVNGEQAACINSCNYTFESAYTPKLTSVSPNSLSDSNTLITITGENYGNDSSRVHVTIGGENCQVVTAEQTSITCTLNRLALGNQPVVVRVDGRKN